MKDEDRADPGLEEIWAIREKLAAEFDYDIRRMGEYFVEQQKQFAERLVPPPEKKKRQKPAA